MTATWASLLKPIACPQQRVSLRCLTAFAVCMYVCVHTGACDGEPLAQAANAAFAQGVIPVAAAGNSADDAALIIPGCASKAVSVGAVFPDAQPAPAICPVVAQPDLVACFSNRFVCNRAWSRRVELE